MLRIFGPIWIFLIELLVGQNRVGIPNKSLLNQALDWSSALGKFEAGETKVVSVLDGTAPLIGE